MSDLSDIEILENDIEEVVIYSSSDEERFAPKAVVVNNVQNKAATEVGTFASLSNVANNFDPFKDSPEDQKSYELLQTTVLELDPSLKGNLQLQKTFNRAISMCKELEREEKVLKMESEKAFQENCKLRKQIEHIERTKRKNKRKVGSINSRRSSGLQPSSQKMMSPEKRRVSMDDSKLKNLVSETEPTKETEPKTENIDTSKYKNPRKKSKKHSGMTDEEKEYYALEEKIEDLLYEVNILWDEVKDDEEISEDEEAVYKEPLKKKVGGVKKEPAQKYLPRTRGAANKSAPKTSPVNQKIMVKNITSLMATKFMNNEDQATSQVPTQRERKVKPKKKIEQDDKEAIDTKESKNVTPTKTKTTTPKKHTSLQPEGDIIIISEGSDSE